MLLNAGKGSMLRNHVAVGVSYRRTATRLVTEFVGFVKLFELEHVYLCLFLFQQELPLFLLGHLLQKRIFVVICLATLKVSFYL
jgi:hypothetical protein